MLGLLHESNHNNYTELITNKNKTRDYEYRKSKMV